MFILILCILCDVKFGKFVIGNKMKILNYNLMLNNLNCLARIQIASRKSVRYYASKKASLKSKISDDESPEIPVNPLREFYSASQQKENGAVYDVKPFKIRCEEGKIYSWCLCGHSKTQPFCDGTHNNIFMKIKLKPIKFTVTKTKDYWLCNCKQTQNRPFCDGTHSTKELVPKKY